MWKKGKGKFRFVGRNMEKKKLGEIATYVNGYAFKPTDWRESGIPIIRIQDLTGLSYQLNYYDSDYPKKIEINNGDVLISWSASLGVYIWDRGKALLNQHIFKVVFDKEEIVKEYFVYAVKFNLKTMLLHMHGATMKHIVKKDFDNIEIPYPSIEKQKGVCKVLSKVEALISKRKQQLDGLDNLIKSRFVEMFGDVFLNDKEYSEVYLDKVADIVSGITKGRKTSETDLQEVPYMAVSNVKDGYIDWTTVKTIMATKCEIEQYRIKPDDILMTEGGDPDKVGRGAIIRKPLENCIHQNHIFRVRLNEAVVLPEYFQEYLQHAKAKRYFLSCAKQTTGIASINMGQLKRMPLLLPPIEIQNEFTDFTKQVDKSKVVVQKSLDETQVLFNSLMQKYFE